jgi:hypothetical protein
MPSAQPRLCVDTPIVQGGRVPTESLIKIIESRQIIELSKANYRNQKIFWSELNLQSYEVWKL